MTVVSTPEERFDDVPDYDYEPRYVDVADGVPNDVDELRMAWVDAGDPAADETFLCLHGEPTWGFLYRKMVPGLAERGRVVVPDAIGFGRSDKFTDRDDYTFDLHYEALGTFLEELDLEDVTLVCQDWGGIIGLSYAAHNPERIARFVAMNTNVPPGDQEMPEAWEQFHAFVERVDELPIPMLIDNATAADLSDEELAAYEAPFPDEASKAGAYEWPEMVPRKGGGAGHDRVLSARERLREWDEPAFVLFADSDPITRPARDDLRSLVPTASDQPETWVEGAMHFLQEDAGPEIAAGIVAFVDRT
jgi:haloalkane dehalogenase